MQFSEIIGQDRIIKSLINSVVENRISHAQLFNGDFGYGGLSLALAYAQFIQCTDKKGNDSCGVCASCIKSNKVVHPDIHFVFPVATTKSVTKEPTSDDFIESWRQLVLEKSFFSVNDWYYKLGIENKQGLINTYESQQLLKKLQFKSYESDYKIAIIWCADKMNAVAANKLLKLIEEPPDKTIFLMLTESTENMLPTIISRTQISYLKQIANEPLKKYLVEQFYLQEEEASELAKLSKGNLLDANNLVNTSEEQTYNFEKFVELMRICYMRKLDTIFVWVDEIATLGRERIKNLLLYSLKMLRENFVINQGNKQLAYVNKNESQFSEKFNPYINNKNAKLMAHHFEDAINDIERNGYNKIILLDVALKITKLIRI